MVFAGLSPMEAIEAASRKPARRFGKTDVGTLEAGMQADMVLSAPQSPAAGPRRRARSASRSDASRSAGIATAVASRTMRGVSR